MVGEVARTELHSLLQTMVDFTKNSKIEGEPVDGCVLGRDRI